MNDDDEIRRRITRAGARRDKARHERPGSLWAQVTRVGTLGWMIAIPIVAGAGLGHLLDRRFGTGVAWALALLLVGVSVAGYALWRQLGEAG